MQLAESISLADYRKLIAAGGNVRVNPKRATPEEGLHRACIEWAVFSTARYPILKWLTSCATSLVQAIWLRSNL